MTELELPVSQIINEKKQTPMPTKCAKCLNHSHQLLNITGIIYYELVASNSQWNRFPSLVAELVCPLMPHSSLYKIYLIHFRQTDNIEVEKSQAVPVLN